MTAYRWPPHEGEFCIENVRSLIANRDASAVRLGTPDGWYPETHAYPVAALQPEICPQPSIFPPSTAACCPWTEWSTAGTVSGVTPGVTTAPFLRVTDDGIPRHRWVWSHQYPSTLSKVWFSRYSTTMCVTGTVLAACGAGAPSTPSDSAPAANAATGSIHFTLTHRPPRHWRWPIPAVLATGIRRTPKRPASRAGQLSRRTRREALPPGGHPRWAGPGLVEQAAPPPQSPAGAVAVLPPTEPSPVPPALRP